jgi:hypothetical protein
MLKKTICTITSDKIKLRYEDEHKRFVIFGFFKIQALINRGKLKIILRHNAAINGVQH